MDNKPQNRVLIIIRGGTLQKVLSTDKHLQVELLDYDDEEFAEGEKLEIKVESKTNNLIEVY